MAIIGTWFAPRQNIEFWKNSEMGLTCASFTAQVIEFGIWYTKLLHFHHATGQWKQIQYICKMLTAGMNGATEFDIPNYEKISNQNENKTGHLYNEQIKHKNKNIEREMSPLFRYLLKLLRKVKPNEELPARLTQILMVKPPREYDIALQTWLESLGDYHSDWRSNLLLRNSHDYSNVSGNNAGSNDAGNSHNDNNNDNNVYVDGNDVHLFDSDGESVVIDIIPHGTTRSQRLAALQARLHPSKYVQKQKKKRKNKNKK